MKNKINQNIYLGLFVAAGLVFLILSLYLIGKNKHLFGSAFLLRARFENIQGLKKGNNVRYAGIDVGTVDNIIVINDTLIEVVMRVESSMKKIIKRNTIVSIGTDGLVGNKVVNMIAIKKPSLLVVNNEILSAKKPVDTDEMLQTLSKTNQNLSVISWHLKQTTQKIDSSVFLNELLHNKTIVKKIDHISSNLESGTIQLKKLTQNLNQFSDSLAVGKGLLGKLLKDTLLYHNANETISSIKTTSQKTTKLAERLEAFVGNIEYKLDSGKGIAHLLMNDTTVAKNTRMITSKTDTLVDHLNQLSEALKHSIFFKGYFRRLEKAKQKDP